MTNFTITKNIKNFKLFQYALPTHCFCHQSIVTINVHNIKSVMQRFEEKSVKRWRLNKTNYLTSFNSSAIIDDAGGLAFYTF